VIADKFFDALLYALFVGGFQALLTALVFAFACIVRFFVSQFGILRFVSSFALFNFWFLEFGLLGNFAWYSIAPGWLYVNHDPVVEFIPFILPGDWTIDVVCHGHLTSGTTWMDMYVCWLCIAAPIWVLTVLAYLRTKRLLVENRLSIKSFAAMSIGAFGAVIGATVFVWLFREHVFPILTQI
jgi:hypothetical protein